MKFWECINVPGMTDVDNSTSVDINDIITDAINTTVEDSDIEIIGVDEAVEKQRVESHLVSDNVVSKEYTDLLYKALPGLQQSLKEHETVEEETVSDEVVEEESAAVETKLVVESDSDIVINENPVSITTDKTPEELDAEKYVSPDDVNIDDYDIDTPPEGDVEEFEEETVDEVISSKVESPALSSDALLNGIYDSNAATLSAPPPVEETTHAPVAEETSVAKEEETFNLKDNELEDVIDTFNRYEKDYFSEIPAQRFNKKFLKNIPKEVYKAHKDAVEKYEAPDLMDPLFYLYITLVKDPWLAVGKFADIIVTTVVDNDDIQECIDKSCKDYDEYIKDFPEELTDEGESNDE